MRKVPCSSSGSSLQLVQGQDTGDHQKQRADGLTQLGMEVHAGARRGRRRQAAGQLSHPGAGHQGHHGGDHAGQEAEDHGQQVHGRADAQGVEGEQQGAELHDAPDHGRQQILDAMTRSGAGQKAGEAHFLQQPAQVHAQGDPAGKAGDEAGQEEPHHQGGERQEDLGGKRQGLLTQKAQVQAAAGGIRAAPELGVATGMTDFLTMGGCSVGRGRF